MRRNSTFFSLFEPFLLKENEGDMNANENKRKTKIHKPGISRNFVTNSNHAQENARGIVSFKRRDSLPEIGVGNSSRFSFLHQKGTAFEHDLTESSMSHNLFKDVPSYNIWKSWASNRRGSVPNNLNLQRKSSTSSSVFVPTVITRETRGFRKYSMPLSLVESRVEKNSQRPLAIAESDQSGEQSTLNVLPKINSGRHVPYPEHSGRGQSPSYCDSDSTLICSTTDMSLTNYNEKHEKKSFYTKDERIKRWLSEVE